jgi:multicomponent Na+:H+ antiporter subunit B
MLLIGLYLVFHAHLTPGGAFPGGAIISTAFALLVITYTEEDVEHRLTRSELIDIKSVAGIILVIVIIRMSHLLREEFLITQKMFTLWSGGFTMLTNVAGSLMIVTALIMIIYSLVRG